MFVFLDVKTKTIQCYTDEGKIDIPFQDYKKLYSISNCENFYYITNVVKTNTDGVVDVISSLGINAQKIDKSMLSNDKYIRYTLQGTIVIDPELQFQGKYDIKPITEDICKKIKTDKNLKKLINSKKIEIISEMKKQILIEEKEQEELKLLEIKIKQDAIKEEKLNNLIFDKNDKKETEDENIIEFDMTSELKRIGEGPSIEKMGTNTMEGLMTEIDKLNSGRR